MINTVDVEGIKYNIVQASAVNQKKLLTLVGGRIALNSATAQVEEISIAMVKGFLITTPEDVLDQIADIVLHQVMLKGNTEALITIDDFQNGMNAYFTLIAEGIKVNLQDFFTWLDTENADARKPTKKSTKKKAQ